MRFTLDEVPEDDLALTAWLLDTHEDSPPTVDVAVNDGEATRTATPPGGGDGYHWGDDKPNDHYGVRPSVLDVTLPADDLRAGENTVTITNTAGSWMVYDAIGIRAAIG